MNSTRNVLLTSAAATMVVTAGNTGAMAADALLKKAPPIQYVRICDQYGAGFFVIPGTQTCLQLRGSIQIDNAFQANQNLVFLTRSGSSGKWSVNQLVANQQENWGFEVNVKPKFDARHETSWGTFRAYVELKGGIDAGLFNDPGGFPGPNPKEANTFSIFRAYMQWVGFSLGEMDSVFSSGGFKDGDLQNIISGEKTASYQFSYTWTPSGPGQPPKKGGAPVPDGWSATISFEEATKDTAKSNFGNGANQGLFLATAGPVGAGGVAISNGPIGWPDVVGRLHYEADALGKDPNFNDQWSIGTFHLVGVLHQIDTIAIGSSGPGPGLSAGSSSNPVICATTVPVACTTSYGVTENSTGWAVGSDMKIFTPMWGPAKRGSIAPADMDSIWLEAVYGVGALNFVGIGGTNGSLQAGDAYFIGGLERDDGDFRAVNNGAGGYTFDKESAFTFNVQYHHIITDCTDPVNCWRFNLAYNYAKVTPGQVTQNTDWTQGGLGVATLNRITANLIWGANRPPVAVPTSAEVSFEVQYIMVNQALPNNCAGGNAACVPIGVAGNGVAAGANIPGTYGVSQNTNGWVGRLTITKGW